MLRDRVRSIYLTAFVCAGVVMAGSTTGSAQTQAGDYGRLPVMPISYTANVGQFDPSVLFQAEMGDATLYFHADGITQVFLQPSDQLTKDHDIPHAGQIDLLDPNYAPRRKIDVTTSRTKFVGANPKAEIVGLEPQRYFKNYFIGSDQSQWRRRVPTYKTILYRDIYPNVDLKYYSHGASVKYDFIVRPGGDISRIRLEYEGMDRMKVTPEGKLRFENRAGFVEEGLPLIYQEIDGVRVKVDGRYELFADGQFGFTLDSETSPAHPIVIDPALLLTTYLGGALPDWGYDVAVAKGVIPYVYVLGHTWSPDFPVDAIYGPYQGTLNGDFDVFLAIYDPSGTVLLSSTYLGGGQDDWGFGLDVDAVDAVYITGTTSSSDFPTVNPYDDVLDGTFDSFVAKVSDTGTTLEFSTFLGGGEYDVGNDLVYDPATEAVFVTGMSYSNDFPTTSGALQEDKDGYWDAFVARLNSVGNVDAATYLGKSHIETSYGISLGSDGVYITGWTWSTDFPATGGAQLTLAGDQDAFVAKLSKDLSSLSYFTYLGGEGRDYGKAIATDAGGSAYITGWTNSNDFPVTFGSYDTTYNGSSDAYVVKLSSNGSVITYGTFLGEFDHDAGYGIAVDDSGRVWVSGRTESEYFPTTGSFSIPHTPNDSSDAFLARFSASGDTLLFSTCLGDTTSGARAAHDWGYGLALWEMPILPVQMAYLTGKTESDELTHSGFTNYNGNYDAFLASFIAVDIEFPVSIIDSVSPDSAQAGEQIAFGGHAEHDTLPELLDQVFYFWESDIDGWLSTEAEFVSDSLSVGVHQISLRVQNALYIWSPETRVTLNITDTLLLPEAVIDSITPILLALGDTVFFGGHGEDPPLDSIIDYRWKSNLDGLLDQSKEFSSTSLSVGVHTISFEVRDDDYNWSTPVTSTVYVQEAEAEQWEISWWYPTYNNGDFDLLMYDRYTCTLLVTNLSQYDQEFNLRINESGDTLTWESEPSTQYTHSTHYYNRFWKISPSGVSMGDWGDSIAQIFESGETRQYVLTTADYYEWIEAPDVWDLIFSLVGILFPPDISAVFQIKENIESWEVLDQAPMQIAHTYSLDLDAAGAAPDKHDTVMVRPYKIVAYVVSYSLNNLGTLSTIVASILEILPPYGPPIAPYFYVAEVYLYISAFAVYSMAHDPDSNYVDYVHPVRQIDVPGYNVVNNASASCWKALGYEAVELYSFADASLRSYGKCVGALQDDSTGWAARQLSSSLAYMNKAHDALGRMNELSAGITANLPPPSASAVDDIKQDLADNGLNAYEVEVFDSFGVADQVDALADTLYAKFDGEDWGSFSSLYLGMEDSVRAIIAGYESLSSELHAIGMNGAIIGNVVAVEPEVIVSGSPTQVTAWIEFPGLLFPALEYSFDSITTANSTDATPIGVTFQNFEFHDSDTIPDMKVTFLATLNTVGYRLESIYGRVITPGNDTTEVDTLPFSAAAIVRVVSQQINPRLQGCVVEAESFEPIENVRVRACTDSLCVVGVAYDTTDADGNYVFPSLQPGSYYVGYSMPGSPIPKISNNPGTIRSVGCVGVNYQYTAYTPADTVYGPVNAESSDTVSVCLVVPDASDTTTWFDQIVGPGIIDPITGEWSYQPDIGDVIQEIIIGIVVCNQFGCSEPTFDTLEVLEADLVFASPCETTDTAIVGSTLQHSFEATSCSAVYYEVIDIQPVPVGSYSINMNNGLFSFIPAAADIDGTFTVIVMVTDFFFSPTCDLSIYVSEGCCGLYTGGFPGNTDCDLQGKRNLADITRLIDYVYISKTVLCCPENGNVNVDLQGKVNLADITKLIDHVYISKNETAACE